MEERGAAVTSADSHQQKGRHIKHFDPLYSTSSTPGCHGSSGQFDSLPVAKQGYVHPEGLCGCVADPLDQSWMSHQALAFFSKEHPTGPPLEGIRVHGSCSAAGLVPNKWRQPGDHCKPPHAPN